MTPNSNTENKLPVMEAFYTIQGEGAHTGRAAYFIRLAGCNVGCVWCDVKESWEVNEAQWQSIDQIVELALQYPSRLVVITGGEPCMYNLNDLVGLLHQNKFEVNIETSGAYELNAPIDWICVSPKKFKSPTGEMLSKANELKVVVFNNHDLEWAVQNASQVNLECKLYLQPEFSKSEKITPVIVDFVKNNPRWRISLQTHKFIGIP
jgi:7-carboxy-7-deazaguanine synthase